MTKSSFFIIMLFVFVSVSTCAQNEGTITINKDYRLEYLMDKYLAIAKYENTIDGFRIQIFFDSGNYSQINANNARTEFLRKQPEIEAYITFDSPYYKVRVGDFRTRLEAQNFLNKINAHYPNAFIVLDRINYPKID